MQDIIGKPEFSGIAEHNQENTFDFIGSTVKFQES